MHSPTRRPFFLLVGTGALCTIVLISLARLAYGLVLPAMRDDLGLTDVHMANLGTATGLGYLSLVIVAGVVAERWGGRLSVLLGLLLVSIGFVGLSQASDYAWLLVFMVVLGCGTAFGYTPLISLLSNCFPERRGQVLGYVNSGVGTGMLFAGYIVPWLSTGQPETDWRTVWLLFALIALLVMGIAAWILYNPEQEPQTALRPEQLGRIYHNRHVVQVGLIYGIVGLTYIVQAIFMYSFALDTGIAPATAGQLVSMMGLLSIVAGPVWGSLSDRMGHSRCLLLCMSLVITGMMLPVIWPTLWVFTLHYFLLGLCTVGMFTSTQALSTENVSPQQAAMAISFITVFFAAGQLVGPFAAGAFLETLGSYRQMFLCACLVMSGGLFLSLKLYRRQAASNLQVD